MPNYPAVYAIRAGLGYILGIGVDKIDAYARPLVKACLDGLRKLPVQMLTPPTRNRWRVSWPSITRKRRA